MWANVPYMDGMGYETDLLNFSSTMVSGESGDSGVSSSLVQVHVLLKATLFFFYNFRSWRRNYTNP